MSEVGGLSLTSADIEEVSKETLDGFNASWDVLLVSSLVSGASSESSAEWTSSLLLLVSVLVSAVLSGVDVSERLGVVIPLSVEVESSSGECGSEPDHWVVDTVGLLAVLTEVEVGLDEGLVSDSLDWSHVADITDDTVMDSIG